MKKMKKIFLLFMMMLSSIVFSQTELVKWTKPTLVPVSVVGVTSTNISEFERTPTNVLNTNNYIQFAIGADDTHQIRLDKLDLNLRKTSCGFIFPQNPDLKYQIRYSKDNVNFTSLIGEMDIISCNFNNVSFNFNNLLIKPNERLYIRIYVYANFNIFDFFYNNKIDIKTVKISGVVGTLQDCLQTTTWNGTSWSKDVPDAYTTAIINGNYSGPNFTSCSLQVNGGSTLNIGSTNTIVVINKLINNGVIIVKNNGSFVQTNKDNNASNIPYNTGSGIFKVIRETKPVFRYDFTYWSSPVKDFVLKTLSPTTLFDKFMSWNGSTQTWAIHKTILSPELLEKMRIGVGYAVRAPQTYAITGTPIVYEATFVGAPNNGKLSTPIYGGINKWNLLGNPYPSALNIETFLLENKTKLDGTIYLWTHNTSAAPITPGSHYYVYSNNDYASYNFTGATNTVGIGVGSVSLPAVKPNKYIASGQSFFVKSNTTFVNGDAIFNNSMRVSENNSQFFRPIQTQPNLNAINKHRVWINIADGSLGFNQILVGYLENATNGLDWGYDGIHFGATPLRLYSLLDTSKLVIQGRALPFLNTDVVPLGYSSNINGTLTISIDSFDGLFENQGIYLEDKLLNVIHDLKASDYIFTSNIGTFDGRFVLRYDNVVLSTITNEIDNVYIYISSNCVNIKTSFNMISVEIYDLLGKTIYSSKVGSNSFKTTELHNGLFIVKITTEKSSHSQKIIIR